jgi:hypothetical protein
MTNALHHYNNCQTLSKNSLLYCVPLIRILFQLNFHILSDEVVFPQGSPVVHNINVGEKDHSFLKKHSWEI